jgi:hypothetical protein
MIMEDGHEAGRWSAGFPDLLDFVLIRDTRQQLKADLPARWSPQSGAGGVRVLAD